MKGSGIMDASLYSGLTERKVKTLYYKLKRGGSYKYERSGPKNKLSMKDLKEIKMMMLNSNNKCLPASELKKKLLYR